MSGHGLGVVQALLAAVIWGASFAATKRLLVECAPATILCARSLIGAVCVAAGAALGPGLRGIPPREWPRLLGLATLGLVLTQLLQAWALGWSTSANTAWLVALNPAVTALLAAWLLGEHLGPRLVGLTLAFAGAVLVVSGGAGAAEVLTLPSTRGDLLTIASTICWGLYTVSGRGFAGRQPAPRVIAYLLALAALAFLPGFVGERGWHELAALSAGGWLCLAYLGVACSGLAFFLYYAALSHLGAGQVAAFIYVEPLIAQVLGVALLGEPLSAAVVTGGVAILAGVWLVSRMATEPARR